jgi:hypothetical protein
MSATTKTTIPGHQLLDAEALLAILETAICDTDGESAPDQAHVRVLLGQVRRALLDVADRIDSAQVGAP